jgi:hypothetical protein
MAVFMDVAHYNRVKFSDVLEVFVASITAPSL